MAGEAISRLGQEFATGDANALFLKVFAGEILATFRETNKFMDKVNIRTISSGKSASFPIVGTAAARWHTPGESVITDTEATTGEDYMSLIKQSEREIFIDDCLTSSVLIDDLDSMKNHFDARSEYASSIGRALAKEADQHILASIKAASVSTANIPGVTAAGDTITSSNMDTDADTLIAAIFNSAKILDQNDVPSEDRYVAVRPAQYYVLAQKTDLVNLDFGGRMNGVYAEGTVLKCAGFTIVATNNMPSDTTNNSAVADPGAKNDPFGGAGIGYNANWTNVEALCFHKSAAGVVKMADLQVLSEYQTERLATLLLAKYAMGHSYLRPECAVSLLKS